MTPRSDDASDRYLVARARDLPAGGRLLVTVRGRQIGIFNIDGKLRAVLNRCPHRGAPLCRGDVLGSVTSNGPGDIRLDSTRKLLVCPWHGWEFDLDTGKSWYQVTQGRSRGFRNARSVGVEVLAGAELDEELVERRTETSPDEATFIDPFTHRREGPYRAELYPVERDAEYIVLSLRPTSTLSGPRDGPPPPSDTRG
jgi:nitrite reductase/ring-hydroxylating ferredoxin subunit